MTRFNRRDFIKKAATAAAVGGAALTTACGTSESSSNGAAAVHTNQTFNWKMVTTWPPKFPVLGEGAELFASWVEEMSAGRLKIQVYGGGELVPPLEAFSAVQQGVVEIGHGASYYWAGKAPATQFFAAVPFGMNAQQMNSWLYGGGGLELWRELYAQFNLVPFAAGNTGVQMAGWFNRKIESIADLSGLKMRIPGLGGKVISKAGASAVLVAGGEIFTNLERGVIDATEWIGPYHDYLMGFPRIAKYYYYPGWHEPGTTLELFVNKAAFEKLPTDLQSIVESACMRSNLWMLSEFESKNSEYLKKIEEEYDTQILPLPSPVLSKLKEFTAEAMEDLTASDPFSKRVYESFSRFQDKAGGWSDLTEKAYFQM